jgi:hypothetical protein
MILVDRQGRPLRVSLSAARRAGNVAEPVAGEAAYVIGTFAGSGVLTAANVGHAKELLSLWPADQ